MRLKSSSLLYAVVIVYGAFVSSIISWSYDESDNPRASQVIPVYQLPKFDQPTTTTTTTTIVVETPKRILSAIPNDPEKRCPKWHAKFGEYSLPTELFSYIAWKESRCNPKAHNTTLNKDGSQDLGLVQINSSWRTVTKNVCGTDITGLFNVDCNLKVAKYLYENGGAAHWSIKE
jgi:hypothetical protein